MVNYAELEFCSLQTEQFSPNSTSKNFSVAMTVELGIPYNVLICSMKIPLIVVPWLEASGVQDVHILRKDQSPPLLL